MISFPKPVQDTTNSIAMSKLFPLNYIVEYLPVRPATKHLHNAPGFFYFLLEPFKISKLLWLQAKVLKGQLFKQKPLAQSLHDHL